MNRRPRSARRGRYQLAPNSTRVLGYLGLNEPLFEFGLEHNEKLNRDFDTGNLTYRVDTKALARMYGAPFLTIHRGDMQAILSSGLPPGTIQLGRKLETLERMDGFTRMYFSDGSTADAEIIVGADGVHSRVRRILLGEEPAKYSGDVAYRAIFPRDRVRSLDIPDCTKWWADDGRYMLIYFISARRDEVYLVGGVRQPKWDGSGFAPVDVKTTELQEAFTGFHPDVHRVLASADEVSKWAVLERQPDAMWSSGQVVLVGDACHPMTPYMGQGAGMAVEDAAVLVRCLQEVGFDNQSAAFEMYQRNRQARTARVQRESKKNEWMRYTMDHGWVFGHDVLQHPLIGSERAA